MSFLVAAACATRAARRRSKPAMPLFFHPLTRPDLLIQVVADNPIGESCHYPDSKKWLVRSPERRLLRLEACDYFDGEA